MTAEPLDTGKYAARLDALSGYVKVGRGLARHEKKRRWANA